MALMEQMMVNVPFTISLFFVYRWIMAAKDDPKIDSINFWDYFHLINILLNRTIVIGIKYGTFSNEYFEIIRKTKLDVSFIDDRLLRLMI